MGVNRHSSGNKIYLKIPWPTPDFTVIIIIGNIKKIVQNIFLSITKYLMFLLIKIKSKIQR